MKFGELPYERIDKEEISKTVKGFTKRLKEASSFEEVKNVFEEFDVYDRHIDTNFTIAYIRHDIDTNDKFYEAEIDYWNETMPALEAEWQEWKDALLESPFRKELEKEFGDIIFVNAELDKKFPQNTENSLHLLRSRLKTVFIHFLSLLPLRQMRTMLAVKLHGRQRVSGTKSTKKNWISSMMI